MNEHSLYLSLLFFSERKCVASGNSHRETAQHTSLGSHWLELDYNVSGWARLGSLTKEAPKPQWLNYRFISCSSHNLGGPGDPPSFYSYSTWNTRPPMSKKQGKSDESYHTISSTSGLAQLGDGVVPDQKWRTLLTFLLVRSWFHCPSYKMAAKNGPSKADVKNRLELCAPYGLDGITDSMDVSLSELRELVPSQGGLACCDSSQRVGHDWVTDLICTCFKCKVHTQRTALQVLPPHMRISDVSFRLHNQCWA